MNKGVKIWSYGPGKGITEHAYGVTNLGAWLMASICSKLKKSSWFVSQYRVMLSGTADALNAVSCNWTTGELWISNALVASWDPTIYNCLWAFESNKGLWTVAQTITYWRGINLELTAGVSSYILGWVLGACNENRTAINNAANTDGFGVFVGFYDK